MTTKITNPLLSQEYIIQEDPDYYWRVREDENGLIRIEYHEVQEGVYGMVEKFCIGQHLLPALIEALQQFVD